METQGKFEEKFYRALPGNGMLQNSIVRDGSYRIDVVNCREYVSWDSDTSKEGNYHYIQWGDLYFLKLGERTVRKGFLKRREKKQQYVEWQVKEKSVILNSKYDVERALNKWMERLRKKNRSVSASAARGLLLEALKPFEERKRNLELEVDGVDFKHF